MYKLLLPAVLLSSFVHAHAAPRKSLSPEKHPLTAVWSWTLPGKQCKEVLEYVSDGTRTSTSGEEVTRSRYSVTSVPSLLGFYKVSETVVETNGKPDCAGDVHEISGKPVTRFIQLSPKKDQLIMCKEESLKACFGPLNRSVE